MSLKGIESTWWPSHDKGTDGDWTHRADRKQSQEQVVAWSQEAGQVLKPLSLTTAPSTEEDLSLKDTTTYPNSATIWRPSVQTVEPEGDIAHSKHNMRTLVGVDERPLS